MYQNVNTLTDDKNYLPPYTLSLADVLLQWLWYNYTLYYDMPQFAKFYNLKGIITTDELLDVIHEHKSLSDKVLVKIWERLPFKIGLDALLELNRDPLSYIKKQKKREYARQYSRAHPDRTHQWAMEHPDLMRQSRKKYETEHRDRCLESKRKYNHKIRDKHKEYMRTYYRENPEQMRETKERYFRNKRMRQWREILESCQRCPVFSKILGENYDPVDVARTLVGYNANTKENLNKQSEQLCDAIKYNDNMCCSLYNLDFLRDKRFNRICQVPQVVAFAEKIVKDNQK